MTAPTAPAFGLVSINGSGVVGVIRASALGILVFVGAIAQQLIEQTFGLRLRHHAMQAALPLQVGLQRGHRDLRLGELGNRGARILSERADAFAFGVVERGAGASESRTTRYRGSFTEHGAGQPSLFGLGPTAILRLVVCLVLLLGDLELKLGHSRKFPPRPCPSTSFVQAVQRRGEGSLHGASSRDGGRAPDTARHPRRPSWASPAPAA